MTSKEILEKYLNFYKQKGHVQVPNVSLVPENDSTLLFVNSGMFPLVPYLSGQSHPLGKRLVNVQRSLRLDDIENAGKTIRHTFMFHMIGNWSLGDYFKDEQLPWAYQFFIEELGLDVNRMFATVFAGDEYAPKDNESIEIIKKIFAKYGVEAEEGVRIFAQGAEDNWWKRGDAIGELGGPDSEVFYYLGEGSGVGKNPAENQEEFLEIGNNVFMQYQKTAQGWGELPQKNVDFGGGLERIAMVVQGKKDIYETDTFWPIISKIEEISGKKYFSDESTTRNMRVVADHIRGCMFIAMDGVIPSNKDQGYVLRRLLRRMTRVGRSLGVEKDLSTRLVGTAVDTMSWLYPELSSKKTLIEEIFSEEEVKFGKTLSNAQKELDRRLSKKTEHFKLEELAFDMYQSLGYPLEIFMEDARERGFKFDEQVLTESFNQTYKAHQESSRHGAEGKFKGGLADHSLEVLKYHTVTHLLHMALRKVLGDGVGQKGSNITNERVRFDFSYSQKLTLEEISEVEKIVNNTIAQKLPVNFQIMPKEYAEKTGAVHFFGEKYGDQVKVYYIGDSIENAVSKEFCGGPHVTNTSELLPVTIYKQENIGKGVMRVYAKFS